MKDVKQKYRGDANVIASHISEWWGRLVDNVKKGVEKRIRTGDEEIADKKTRILIRQLDAPFLHITDRGPEWKQLKGRDLAGMCGELMNGHGQRDDITDPLQERAK